MDKDGQPYIQKGQAFIGIGYWNKKALQGCGIPCKDIKEAVEQASSKEEYPFEFDVKGFKHDFAVVMSILESASSDADIEEETEIIEFHIPENKEETVVKDNKVEMFETRRPRRFGNVAAIALVALAAGITAFNTIGKGGI